MKRGHTMPKDEELSALDMARQRDGESVRSILCECCGSYEFERITVGSELYNLGFRFKCSSCGMLKKGINAHNILFSD
jgi:hypothetical protein